jgi:hypothetical protein
MIDLLTTLKTRNEALFWFGLINLGLSLLFIVLSRFSSLEVMGANAWIKPTKFALSTVLLSWAMAWYTGYLQSDTGIGIFNWVIIITLAFEVAYIAIQAARGQMSHFNLSTPFYQVMYSLMAIAASIATLAVGYIGYRFFGQSFPELPDYYLWAIRIGIILFVIFSFEGFVMGSRLSHTIGGPDGGKGLPFLNWSRQFGDPRVAHFVGMHALQAIPLLSFFVFNVSFG